MLPHLMRMHGLALIGLLASTLGGCVAKSASIYGHDDEAEHVDPVPATITNFGSVWLQEDWIRPRIDGSARATLAATLATSEIASHHPVFEDARSILRHVLSHAPEVLHVYPTELYYYFMAPLPTGDIAGNVRFTDADKGIIHVGYYYRDASAVINYAGISSADGVEMTPAGPDRYRVSFDGITRLVVLDGRRFRVERPRLLPTEEFVCSVLDESGFAFSLIYNHLLHNFLFLLADDRPPPEPLTQVPLPDDFVLLNAQQSRFVFYVDRDYGRTILIGVSRGNIAVNNYFDGPFDQVPPNLEIRTRLLDAYPYIRETDGIDEHGNFLKRQGERVAITPYTAYGNIAEVIDLVRASRDSSLMKADLYFKIAPDSKRAVPLRQATPRQAPIDPLPTETAPVPTSK